MDTSGDGGGGAPRGDSEVTAVQAGPKELGRSLHHKETRPGVQYRRALTTTRPIGKGAHPRPSGYGDRPSAESAAIRKAAAMKERLSFGMTAFFLSRWILAVSVSFSRATLI